MFYLILAVLSAAANGVIIRLSQNFVKNKFSMLAGNYVVCLVLALIYLYPAALFPRQTGLDRALGLGLVNGLLFLAGFAMIQYNTRVHGVVLTSIFSRLGVLVPTLLAVTLFGEVPTFLQLLGIGLALAAILVMNLEKGSGFKGAAPALIIMLLLNGSCDGMAKVYEQVGSAALSEQFLVYTFFAALAYNIVLILYKKEKPGPIDFAFGALLGVPNYFVARFLLKAVGQIPAVIVYPSYSVGSIVLTTAAGLVLFGETISRRQKIAVVLILAALVLLNL